MEQYLMPKELDWDNLRLCLEHYEAESIFIRDKGGYNPDGSYRIKGLVKVKENLEGRKEGRKEGRSLDFRKDDSGLHIIIDDEEVFHFPLEDYGTRDTDGFTLAYERIETSEDGIETTVMLGRGVDPYDKNLPEPQRSFLRHALDDHLMEIYFKGRVKLKFHSWMEEPHWKYWTIDKPGCKDSC